MVMVLLRRALALPIASTFASRRCALCGCELIPNEIGLCDRCSESLPRIKGERCGICGKPLISERSPCGRCRTESFLFDACSPVFLYHGLMKGLVRAYKESGNIDLARFFAKELTKVISDVSMGFFGGWGLCAVPPRRGAARARGWEHMARISFVLHWEFGIRVIRPLRRLEGQAQKTLGREDRITRRYAFEPRPCAAKAERVLLIDDVMTTGATLSACAGALKRAGASEVRCVTLCQVA